MRVIFFSLIIVLLSAGIASAGSYELIGQVNKLFESREYEQAITLCESILADSPSQDVAMETYGSLAYVYIVTNRKAEANETEEILKNDYANLEGYPDVLIKLGDGYLFAQKSAKAVDYYEQALSYEGIDNIVVILGRVASGKVDIGDVNGVELIVDNLTSDFAQEANSISVINEIAEKYYMQKKYDDCLVICQKALHQLPWVDEYIVFEQGTLKCFIRLRDFENYDEQIGQFFSRYSQQETIYKSIRDIGQELLISKEFQRAVRLFSQAIQSCPGNEDSILAQEGLALSYIYQDDEVNATKAVNDLIDSYSAHSQISWAVDHIADAYRHKQDYEKAISCYDLILNKWPDAGHAVGSQMGKLVSYIYSEDLESAQTETEKLISDYNDFTEYPELMFRVGENYYLKGLGVLKRKTQEEAYIYFDRGFEVLMQMIEECPNSDYTPNAYYYAGLCSRKRGDHGSAIVMFEQLANEWPFNRYTRSARIRQIHCIEDFEDSGMLNFQEYEQMIKDVCAKTMADFPNDNAAVVAQNALTRLSQYKKIRDDQEGGEDQ